MRILVVESSKQYCRTLLSLLPNTDTIACLDGERAVTLIDQLQPDILILHTALRRKDGMEVLQQISFRPEIILVLTNYLSPYLEKQLYELGASCVMAQPMAATAVAKMWTLYNKTARLLPSDNWEHDLSSLGLPPNRLGWQYILQAASLLQKDPGRLLVGDIYQTIGEPRAVERAIRIMIQDAYLTGDRQLWKNRFPMGCPTNKAFLFHLIQFHQYR